MIAKVINALAALCLIVLIPAAVEGGGMTVLQGFIALPIITVLILCTAPKTGWYDEDWSWFW